jgi:hypothetical protein
VQASSKRQRRTVPLEGVARVWEAGRKKRRIEREPSDERAKGGERKVLARAQSSLYRSRLTSDHLSDVTDSFARASVHSSEDAESSQKVVLLDEQAGLCYSAQDGLEGRHDRSEAVLACTELARPSTSDERGTAFSFFASKLDTFAHR